jgi:hypothetical protein
VQLNVIRLLADLTVAVNKSEVVDMILPLFIESLEEGEASTPGLLRLRVGNLCLWSNLVSDIDLIFSHIFFPFYWWSFQIAI